MYHTVLVFYLPLHSVFSVGGFQWQLTEFIIGVFLQVLGLPFVAVAQVSLFSKVTAERTQGENQHCLVDTRKHCFLNDSCFLGVFIYLFIFNSSFRVFHETLACLNLMSLKCTAHFQHVSVKTPAPCVFSVFVSVLYIQCWVELFCLCVLSWYCRFQSGSASLSGRSSYHPGPSVGWWPHRQHVCHDGGDDGTSGNANGK